MLLITGALIFITNVLPKNEVNTCRCLHFELKLIKQGVQIQCVGEGPVVHVTPNHVDYGTIPVLTDISKIVQLSNESLIPAQFSCSMVSQWMNVLEMYYFIKSRLMCASKCAYCVLLLNLQVRPNSLFSVDPAQGVIPPEDVLKLKVTASVDDTVK